jgi:hypothetical protein
MPDLDQLDVFYGELTVHRAYVYARLRRPEAGENWSLSGQVRGPRCLHARALPASAKLVDQGPGPTLLARAVLPDPCCWSPDLPAIYDVMIDLVRGGEVVVTARRELGLRMLGVRRRDLALEGKRWVLRGVGAASTTARLPREWHEAPAALLASDPNEEQLAEAAQWGALAIVEIGEPGDSAIQRLHELARCPAVAIAVLRGELPADFVKSQFAPNLLLAQPIGPGDTRAIQPWAELAVVSADEPNSFSSISSRLTVPVLAQRRLRSPLPIAAARAACDTLQRELAPIGQFAGYIV